MRKFLAILTIMLVLPITGCFSTASLYRPDPGLAHYTTLALPPVTFSSQQTLPNERAAIATVLEKTLTEELEGKGYAVVPSPTRTASALLNIDITYIWDGRLYGGARTMNSQLYPKLELYCTVTVTDLKTGKVVQRKEVQASAQIDALTSPAPEANYTAPQKNLARNISRLFPSL